MFRQGLDHGTPPFQNGWSNPNGTRDVFHPRVPLGYTLMGHGTNRAAQADFDRHRPNQPASREDEAYIPPSVQEFRKPAPGLASISTT